MNDNLHRQQQPSQEEEGEEETATPFLLPSEILIQVFLWLTAKELNRQRQLSLAVKDEIHSQDYIWKKMYSQQSRVPLEKVSTMLRGGGLRVVLIKTENSIQRLLENHEKEQDHIASVIKAEKERQSRLLQQKLVAKQQAKLQEQGGSQ